MEVIAYTKGKGIKTMVVSGRFQQKFTPMGKGGSVEITVMHASFQGGARFLFYSISLTM